jgi:hypothetical protein
MHAAWDDYEADHDWDAIYGAWDQALEDSGCTALEEGADEADRAIMDATIAASQGAEEVAFGAYQ